MLFLIKKGAIAPENPQTLTSCPRIFLPITYNPSWPPHKTDP